MLVVEDFVINNQQSTIFCYGLLAHKEAPTLPSPAITRERVFWAHIKANAVP